MLEGKGYDPALRGTTPCLGIEGTLHDNNPLEPGKYHETINGGSVNGGSVKSLA